MEHFESIVLGCGGVGSAALLELARRGVKTLGLDRFPPAHVRGSSHGDTRIIRQAYFEHSDYVPLLLRSYDLWESLAAETQQPLYHEVGLVEIGPPEGVVVPGVMESARRHGLEIESLSAAEVAQRWPGFHAPEEFTAVFERRAGYLLVEACIRTQLAAAQQSGAVLRTGEAVERWAIDGQGVRVETANAVYAADRLIVTAGAWANQLLAGLGLSLEVRRKPFFYFKNTAPALTEKAGCPCYFFELPEGHVYGFPQFDARGVKVAEHSGGDTVADPLTVDRTLHEEDYARIAAFVQNHLPGATSEMSHHAVCMYTMTRDANFIIDRHPTAPQVAFAAGLSGHGFKFTPVLAEALADLALSGKTSLPVEFLSLDRPGLRGA